ncbi:IS1634 family transposase [Enterococcus cecorum]|uniref:IS1634 family transposase n=1 Tax=Enterococcus cecorum TaxID=44008 RepID=UPI000DEBF7BD|nr:IS1634 family transposase [Enterococcus cecorum]RBR29888.1 hypothetical protein EB08_01122 [Enterococcus cecorum]RBR38111.1 hypothetical protein EB31_00585 [Enterococcus cecorum]
MGMRLKSTKSKYSESFSIIDDYTHPETNKRSTFVVEALGSLNSLMEKYQTTDREVVVNHLKDYIEERKQQLKAENGKMLIEVAQKDLIEKDETRIYNVGYLYIKDILCSLGLKRICQEIQTRYKIQFNLFDILCDLVCTRIIEPCSKRATFEYKKRFLHQSTYQLEDVYRALHILYQERYTIENALYQGSTKLYPRNTNVLYYDCTNFYFETEEPDEFRLYGFSKEHRPNPIVQYGLFMDGNGIPLADYAFAGNMNEQPTLRKLEQKIEEDFQLKKFIVVADAGLNGWENKVYNNMKNNHAYIVTQPIKKLKKSLQEWAIDPSGWRISGSREKFNLQDIMNAAENAETDLKHYKINIDGTERNVYDLIFYKERWEKTTKKSDVAKDKYSLEERYIVSFSFRQRAYHEHIRQKKIDRALKFIENPSKLDRKNQRQPSYYIKTTTTTEDGEIASNKVIQLDTEKIKNEAKLDGFYVVTTDLEDKNIGIIIQANRQRWEIEESFRIMRSEFRTRPMYVRKEESINGHLLTCFIALLVYRILEKHYLSEKYSPEQIITTLRQMNIVYLEGSNYTPAFDRTDLVDELMDIFGFQVARKILSQKYIKKFSRVVNSEKSTKIE